MQSTLSRYYVVEGIRISLDVLKALADDLPAPASSIINLAQQILAIAEAVQTNREDCDQLRDRILQILPVLVTAMTKQSSGESQQSAGFTDLMRSIERFQRSLETILESVTKIKDVVNSTRKRDKVGSWFLSRPHKAALQKCKDDLAWAMSEFQVTTSLADSVRLCEMSRKVEVLATNNFLEALPRSKYASFSCERSERSCGCFEGTRTDILKLIMDWVTSPDPTLPRFFWLNGIAGIGKTTIAHSIAELASQMNILGANFFFSRRCDAELRNPALVFPTIAYQLARFDAEFGRRISAALEKDPEAPFATLKQQFDRLIIKPLTGLKRDPTKVVLLVLDGFDECETQGAKDILKLLVAARSSLPFCFKIFITSRPEQHIRAILVPSSGIIITALHDIETSVVKSDIRLYLRARLRRLPAELGHSLREDWVEDHEIELLVEKAGNLFIHAETAVRYLLRAWNLRTQLNLVLEAVDVGPARRNSQHSSPFFHLDRLYLYLLQDLFSEGNPDEVQRMLQLVLGSIAILRDPLPADALGRLIGLAKDEAEDTLAHLHSVIIPPGPLVRCPRVYHPSFSDFLQDRARCPDERLWVNTEQHEARIAIRCLDLLNKSLHKSLLGKVSPALLNSEVENLEQKIKSAFSAEFQYACLYWASHLCAASYTDTISLGGYMELFAYRSLLPWLEAMSWLGEVRLAVHCLEIINNWVLDSPISSKIKSLFKDAYRLLLANFSAISLGALHLARSVLPFAPQGTRLSSCYANYSDTYLKILHGGDSEWSPCLMTLSGHSENITSVAFSPDATRFASGSHDTTIRVWDDVSGETVAVLSGHSDKVTAVAFSPDGSQIASGSRDCTIRLWDATSGDCLVTLNARDALFTSDQAHHSPELPLPRSKRPQPPMITSVSFSSDGSHITSSSLDGIVRIWSVITGSNVATLHHHDQSSQAVNPVAVNAAVLAPDGTYVVSGCADHTVQIWNVSGAATVLKGHTNAVTSVTVSRDGSRIASGSRDHTVRIWSATSRDQNSPFDNPSQSSSPSAPPITRGHTIRIWDAMSSDAMGRVLVEDTSNTPEDESLLSSVGGPNRSIRMTVESQEHTVRIWTAGSVDLLKGHTSAVNSVAFSSDDSRIVSGSSDRTVLVWNATNGSCVAKLEGHVAAVMSVAFSPDGSRVLSGSQDQTARIWYAASEDTVETIGESSSMVTSVTFSRDGFQFAAGTYEGSLQVWDMTDGNYIQRLEAHSSVVTSVAFSPNGRQLASGGRDKSVRLWDATSGDLAATLEGHTLSVTSLAFSPNGTSLASGSDDNIIRMWDVATASITSSFRGHEETIASLAFSPNNSNLVSGSWDGSVLVWDTLTGTIVTTLDGHPYPIVSVMFSDDGLFILSTSSDNTTLLWDAPTGRNITEPLSSPDQSHLHFSPIIRPDGEGSRLSLCVPLGPKRLVCLMPRAFPIVETAAVEMGNGRCRVALGRADGRVVVLEVDL